jgi:glutathione S-transferase
VQRVWVALEAKGLQYQYIEVDPYKKPQALLDVNPRGLVPGLRHGDWGCGESTVLMEYVRTNSYFSYGFTLINIQLEDLGAGQPLLPQGNPQLRATCRLWSDHVGPPNLSEKCTN